MTAMAMNGHILKGTPICVDYWLDTPDKKYTRFLSHLHADHTYRLSSKFKEVIFTSFFNSWLVKQKFKLPREQVVGLSLNDPHLVCAGDDEYFSVTLVNANHCPGSVMFYFEGDFGRILYTGDFRYSPEMLKTPSLKSAIDNKLVDELYLDNTFAAEHCRFPSRQEALKHVIQLIKEHPDHYIVIGVRQLGKEDALRDVAKEFKVKIAVSEERMKILQHIHYAYLFTTNSQESRIQARDMHLITGKYIHKLKAEKGPVLTILLSAMHSVVSTSESKSKTEEDARLGIHRIPYSDHSDHQELVEFVSAVKPRRLYPIVRSADDCSRIPRSISSLCLSGSPEGEMLQTSQSGSVGEVLSMDCPEVFVGNVFQSVTDDEEQNEVADQSHMDITDTQVGKIYGKLQISRTVNDRTKDVLNQSESLQEGVEVEFMSLTQEDMTKAGSSALFQEPNDKSFSESDTSNTSIQTVINVGKGFTKAEKRQLVLTDLAFEQERNKSMKLEHKPHKANHTIIKSLPKHFSFPKNSSNFAGISVQNQGNRNSPTLNQQRNSSQNPQRVASLTEVKGNHTTIKRLPKHFSIKEEPINIAEISFLNQKNNSTLNQQRHLSQKQQRVATQKKCPALNQQSTSSSTESQQTSSSVQNQQTIKCVKKVSTSLETNVPKKSTISSMPNKGRNLPNQPTSSKHKDSSSQNNPSCSKSAPKSELSGKLELSDEELRDIPSSPSTESPPTREPEERFSDKFKDLVATGRYDAKSDSFCQACEERRACDGSGNVALAVPSPVGLSSKPVREEEDLSALELVKTIVRLKEQLAKKLPGGRQLSDNALFMIANMDRIYAKWSRDIDNLPR